MGYPEDYLILSMILAAISIYWLILVLFQGRESSGHLIINNLFSHVGTLFDGLSK
jgi:hypothetical protein